VSLVCRDVEEVARLHLDQFIPQSQSRGTLDQQHPLMLILVIP
jgi:hypothetical protein